MRLLLRLLLFWLVMTPILWFWGLPYLAERLSEQTREQNMLECSRQWAAQPAPLGNNAALGKEYCGCLVEVLQFSREDLLEVAQTRALPNRLNEALARQGEQCNRQVEQQLQRAVPLRQHETGPGGAKVIYFR